MFSVSGTGTYQKQSGPYNSGINTFSYCTPYVSGIPTAYVSGNQFDFGANLSEIVIVNPGSQPIGFQWKENFGKAQDDGIVLAGDKQIFRRAVKGGIAIRSCGTNGAECVVFGI